MERERHKEIPKEAKEKSENELDELRKELARLKALKEKKELMKEAAAEGAITEKEKEIIEKDISDDSTLDDIEKRLQEMDKFITKEITSGEKATYDEHSEYIESELKYLESELSKEKGIIEEKISAYEKIVKDYPWIEEQRYKFMYTMPNKKKNSSDYESWKTEWSKVLFDYAKYGVLHIIYIRKLSSEKPFSNFENREKSIKEIAEELIDQDLAEWLSKKKNQLRIYWKSLEGWSDEIYDYLIDLGKLEPVLLYELRESEQEFSNIPKDDMEKIFKILEKDHRGRIIELEDGELAIKIKLE